MSPIDRLRQQAKADIIVYLTWIVNQTGPKKSITYTLQGVDSYTNKQVAGDTGTGAPSCAAEVARRRISTTCSRTGARFRSS